MYSRGVIVRSGALLACLAVLSVKTRAHADNASPSPPVVTTQIAAYGVAVVAVGDAASVAWPLAQSVYADEATRPRLLDEAHARVLVGEATPENAAPDVRDLADLRRAIHGDDAPSRSVLASIASSLHVRAIALVSASNDGNSRHALAQMFDATSATFEPAKYAPDDGEPSHATWTGATRLLVRMYGGAAIAPSAPSQVSATAAAPSLALTPVPPPTPKPTTPDHKAFYASPWFWGAIGTAAFAGVAAYFATRSDDSGTIHLQLQVPK